MAECIATGNAAQIDLAMKYLEDIEDLKETVEECGHNLKIEKTRRTKLAEAEVRNNSELKMLRHEIDARDFEIKRLSNALNHLRSSSLKKLVSYEPRTNPPHSKANVTHKVRILIEHVQQDQQKFKLTGKYDNIDERILEIRGFFNSMLAQLNECTNKNYDVKRTLQAMKSLDGAETALQNIKDPEDQDLLPTRRGLPRIQVEAYDYQKFTS